MVVYLLVFLLDLLLVATSPRLGCRWVQTLNGVLYGGFFTM